MLSLKVRHHCSRGACAIIAAACVNALGSMSFAQNVGANFTAITSANESPTHLSPPDTMGAVGPNQWVELINGGFKVFNKAGAATTSLVGDDTFWLNAGIPASIVNVGISDPRVIYDQTSGRWFASEINVTLPTNNTIMIARSDTADASGTWKGTYVTLSNGTFGDQDTFGIDANAVYLSTNNFNSAGTSNVNTGILSIPKASLLTSTPTTTNSTFLQSAVLNTVGYSLEGVTNFSPTHATTTKLIGVSNTLTQYTVTPLNGTTTAGATLGTTATVNPVYSAIPNPAIQPNSGNTAAATIKLDSGDDRIANTVLQVGNNIYIVHGIGDNGRAELQYTVLNATTNAIITKGTIGEASFDLYDPSIAANANGDVVIGYSRSGFVSSGNVLNRYPSANVIVGSTNVNTGVITFGSQIQLQAGLSDINDFPSSNVDRWGDYSATRNDPADPGIFWTTQAYANSDHHWATRVGEIIPTVAGEVRWQNAASGSFASGASWFNGAVPGPTSNAIFSRASVPYTVTFPAGTTSNDRGSIRQGDVTLSIPAGGIYSLTNSTAATPSLAIGEYQATVSATISGGGTLQTVNTTLAAGQGGGAAYNGSIATFNVGSFTTWNNSANAYIGGTSAGAGGVGILNVTGGTAIVGGTLQVWQTSAVNVTGGTISPNLFSVDGSVTVGNTGTVNATGITSAATPGSVSVFAGGTLTSGYIRTGSLTLTGLARVNKQATRVSSAGVSVVNSLAISGAGQLDLNNSDLIVKSGTTTLAIVTGYLQSGFNGSGGAWTGPGIASTMAAATDVPAITALGVKPITVAGSFDGQPVAIGDVVVKYTYYGDADLSGTVTGNDYTLIDNAFGSPGTFSGWVNGDFNYDGAIDGSDYSLIDNAYNTQGASLAATPSELIASVASEIALGPGTAVPEPSSLAMIGLSLLAVAQRSRKAHC